VGQCATGCRTDADCGVGQLCYCGDPIGQCVQASCRTDSDCGSGYHCISYSTCAGGGEIGFACQTATDFCANDSDCFDNGFDPFCEYVAPPATVSANDQ
jgi:hypothetical protein